MAVVAVEGSLSLTVIDETKGVVVVFRRKYAPKSVRAGKAKGVIDGEEQPRCDGFRRIPDEEISQQLLLKHLFPSQKKNHTFHLFVQKDVVISS